MIHPNTLEYVQNHPIASAFEISRMKMDMDKNKDRQDKLIQAYDKSLAELNAVCGYDCKPYIDCIKLSLNEYKRKLYILNPQNIYGKPILIKNGVELFMLSIYYPMQAIPAQAKNILSQIYNNLVALKRFDKSCSLKYSLKYNREYKKISYIFCMEEIRFKYGLPEKLSTFENFFVFNGILMSKERAVIYPKNIRELFEPENISDSVLMKVKKLLFRFCPKIEIHVPKGIQYTVGENDYAVSYKKNQFSAQLFKRMTIANSDKSNNHSCVLKVSTEHISEPEKSKIKENLNRLSYSTIQGFLFWSNLVACVYGKDARNKVFLVFLKDPDALIAFFNNIEYLFGTPHFFKISGVQELSCDVLEYQLWCDRIGILSFDITETRKYELLEKLVKGVPLTITESVSDWKIQYKNTMPLVILIHDKKELEDLKKDCRQKEIHCYEFLPEKGTHLDELSEKEIAFLKGCLLSAYYHKLGKVKSLPLSQTNLLNEFITTFCEITGEEDDNYRSGDFYSQYVKAYYEVNRSPVIGSKVFNKFLRSYCPDKLRVAPLHVSASNNVQHIFGMKFDKDRFRQYIEDHQAEKAKQQRIFDSYIEDIFSYVEKDFADIYDAIAASIDSSKSPLQ